MTMLEKMAFGIAKAARTEPNIANAESIADLLAPEHWLAVARAALEAIREPSEAFCARPRIGEDEVEDWQHNIDDILRGEA